MFFKLFLPKGCFKTVRKRFIVNGFVNVLTGNKAQNSSSKHHQSAGFELESKHGRQTESNTKTYAGKYHKRLTCMYPRDV